MSMVGVTSTSDTFFAYAISSSASNSGSVNVVTVSSHSSNAELSSGMKYNIQAKADKERAKSTRLT